MAGVFQSNVFDNVVFQGPHASGPSTEVIDPHPGMGAGEATKASGWIRHTQYALKYSRNDHEKFKRKRKLEIAAEQAAISAEQARRDAMRPLARLDEDIAKFDAVFEEPKLTRDYIKAQEDRAALLAQRPAIEKQQKVEDLAEEIRAKRRAVLERLNGRNS